MIIKSYAKINLSIDVGHVQESGMHPVDMIMQKTSLYDEVTVTMSRRNKTGQADNIDKANKKNDIVELPSDLKCILTTESKEIPKGRNNIAVKAAELMAEEFGLRSKDDLILINIDKKVPVAAGLAGGSGNAAAVLHGINALWNLDLSLSELCEIGSRLGSDIPFSIVSQAASNQNLSPKIKNDPMAVTCVRARGTGTELTPITPLKMDLILAKPKIGISTKEVYSGIDSCDVAVRPDNDELSEHLNKGDISQAISQMINVLENYTLNAYPEVKELKSFIKENITGAKRVLMSGSGPTIFALMNSEEEAVRACEILKNKNYEAYACKTE